MILSVSRRTDVPAYYMEWFMQRLRAGEVLVRNPVNPRRVARLDLSPDVVDGIVFWTKNPAPLLGQLDTLAAFPYYVQVTINPYGIGIEPNVPGKGQAVIPAFQRLSEALGPARMHWRYDPILLNAKYTQAYHADAFEKIARKLAGYADRCVFSFIDAYKNTERNAARLGLQPITEDTMRRMAATLAEIAGAYGIALHTCAEAIDLTGLGIGPAHCVDASVLEGISGVPLCVKKDRNQRAACGCVESIDIGAYNCCENGCLYCYANYDAGRIARNVALHDPASPMLIGRPDGEDTVYERRVGSCADPQLRFFVDGKHVDGI